MKDINNTISVNFVLACDYVFLAEGGKLSMIGVFDYIGVQKFPSGHPEMFVVASFKGTNNSEHDIKVEITDPQGKNIFPNKPAIKIKLGPTGIGNLVNRFLNFPINLPGQYTISLFEKGKEIGKSILPVMHVGGDNKKGKIIS